jgi:hypothetical protein
LKAMQAHTAPLDTYLSKSWYVFYNKWLTYE